MDGRSWSWRRRSSERITGLIGSSESSPAHSSRYSDDQDTSIAAANHVHMSEEAMMAWQQSEEKLKSLNEKLSLALSDNTAKDNLVKQHAKVAEEAVSGWEKAETEAMALKQEFDTLMQQKLALEDRVGHLDGALKECMRQLRHVREEKEEKIHEAVAKKAIEWDKTKFELDARIVELEQLLLEEKAKHNTMADSQQESSKLTEMHEAKNQAEAETKVLQVKVESLVSENAALKYKLHALNKEMDTIIEERDLCKKSAEAANKQHSETVKKTAKLEAECQRLRGLVRKRLPGPAALAQMKLEVETTGKEAGEVKFRKSFSRGATSPISSTEFSNDNHREHAQKETEYLTERLSAMEEKNKMLKDTLSKRDSELKASRVMCARTASKLSSVEEQLESLMGQRQKPILELHLEGSRSGSTSNPPSMTSISEDGNDGEPSAESWASALIAELDQFKKEKVSGKIEKLSETPKVDLMDDFLQMEKLASMPSARLGKTGIEKVDKLTEKNVVGGLSASSVQEDKASLEETLAQRELELLAANRECSDLVKKLTSVQEKLTALQAKNALNESTLVSLQDKLDVILETEDEGADLHKVLEDVRNAMVVVDESATDPYVCIRPLMKVESTSLSDSGSKIRVINVELATAISSVVNFVQCIAQQPGNTQFKASEVHRLDARIPEFAELVDWFLLGKAKIVELITELITFLSLVRTISAHDYDEISQNEATDFESQTSDTIRFSSRNNRSSKDSLSGQESSNSLHFPLQNGNFRIIWKLNSIQVEKAALESELKTHIGRYADLEEELMHLKTQKATLDSTLAKTREKLEHTEDQLTESEQMVAKLQVQLASAQESKQSLEYELDAMASHKSDIEEELMQLETKNTNLESALSATKEKFELMQDQLTESEQKVDNLEEQLASAQESNRLSEYELGAMALRKSDIESQLQDTENEMKNLCEKVDALESELQEERMRYQDTVTKYNALQEQLQRKERDFEYSKHSVLEEDIRKRQEKDIAAAAGKLAECQETILVLSRQLKALACPADSMEFPYDAEKRTERDQRFELDAPWSPRSQSASWASEPENFSTANGRGRATEWTSESGLAASDLYKVNLPDSPIVDYLDGRLTMATYSDTEESSPARSPVKSTQQRNKFTCFSAGSEFPKSLKTYGGESPTSSSSSSSLASTFFAKSRE